MAQLGAFLAIQSCSTVRKQTDRGEERVKLWIHSINTLEYLSV